MLPLPLLHRSIVISMQRSSAQLRRLDEVSHVFNLARQGIRKWSATVQLAQDPEMPPALRNRAADNWRILISIADSLGYGEDARAAAVALSSDRLDEDAGVVLLTDIWTIFQAGKVDRIGSAALIEALVELGDGRCAEFRGVNDDRPPRKLTQPQLAQLLRPFGIGSRTIWPPQRKPGDKSSRGYLQSQFEIAWRAYCFAADTPTQPSKIMELSGP
jgi:hypothetical protein